MQFGKKYSPTNAIRKLQNNMQVVFSLLSLYDKKKPILNNPPLVLKQKSHLKKHLHLTYFLFTTLLFTTRTYIYGNVA